jgi:Uma2 family endonuclease
MNQPAQSILQEEPARFSIAEFAAIADAAAALDMADRLELIEGVIARVPPALLPHMKIVNDIGFILRSLCERTGSRFTVFCETGLQLSDTTLRQPDILMFELKPDRRYVEPADVQLAIEVSDTTLALDMGPRRLRFALAGVPHYWVFDMEAERIHLFSAPVAGDYMEHAEEAFGSVVAVPGLTEQVRLP